MKINHDFTRKSTIGKTLRKWKSERSFLGFVKNRIEWHYFPRLSILKEYPVHVDIEPTSHCQLECPMCFRQHRTIENEGIMKMDLYKKIIDELEGKVYSLKFTGRGEPLINKKFSEMMEYLKGKKFGEIALITNGQLLTEKVMHSLIDNGVDRVAFSIDGNKDEYERIRAPIKYEEIVRIVTRFHELKKEKSSAKPLIRIQGVKSCINDEKEFLSTWEPISDEVLMLVFKDYSVNARGEKQAGYACPFLYQRAMIHWNGTVPMCINDEYEEGVMGDLNQKSMGEIWMDKKFQGARLVHQKGLRDKIYKNCAKCALQREGHGYKSLAYLAQTFWDKLAREKKPQASNTAG